MNNQYSKVHNGLINQVLKSKSRKAMKKKGKEEYIIVIPLSEAVQFVSDAYFAGIRIKGQSIADAQAQENSAKCNDSSGAFRQLIDKVLKLLKLRQ